MMSSARHPSRVPARLRPARSFTLVALLLAGCAAVPDEQVGAQAPALFDDAQFGPAQPPLEAATVFGLSPEMKRFLDADLLPTAHALGSRKVLTEALYTHGRLRLEYESSMTRNAGEAFAARSGNCLSLVIMTGAFATAMGLEVSYQSVTSDEMWSRAGDMYFMSGHVNLSIAPPLGERLTQWSRAGAYTIDFMPPDDAARTHVHAISEATVLAMYLNNLAAEAMVQGRLAEAYWHARQAVVVAPAFLSAYNTLGVIYLRHGDARHAEAVLRHVLDRTPDNAVVLTNQLLALRALGRDAEAARAAEHLARIEPVAPFHYFELGRAALNAGDPVAARGFFSKEIERAPDYHEFHFWLAVADAELGRLVEARAELMVAMDDAGRHSDRELYAAKLDKLKAWQAAAGRLPALPPH